MAFTEKFMRKQIELIFPKIDNYSLDRLRKAQDMSGSLMRRLAGRSLEIEKTQFERFEAAWVFPPQRKSDTVILYLHGGGYTCGNIDYAIGFASTLAKTLGLRVFAPAYRLAPEDPYPAAVDDVLKAYEHLLFCGVSPKSIILCGESAGGGLCYALSLRLAKMGKEVPAGIIAISPWVDLTLSGDSIVTKKDLDIALTYERLRFFADAYVGSDYTPENPEISPIFADVSEMPPSLIFVGSDELLFDDAIIMERKLFHAGRSTRLIIGERMWHAYTIYSLKDHSGDFVEMESFIDGVVPAPRKLRWMKLDNAAKIYPAAKRRNWNNTFRLSATLNEPINRDVLRLALDTTIHRFPSIAAKLRRGTFWYYLEELSRAPEIEDDRHYPLMHMPIEDIRKCALRVLVYNNRIAVEFYHALTDGNGGLVFLKSLVAEYLERKHAIRIPATDGVLDRNEEPSEEELVDSFLEHSGDVSKSRSEPNSYRLSGIPEKNDFINLTTFMISSEELRAAAKAHGVTVTTFLASALVCAIAEIQNRELPRRAQKPVKILIPVDLRRIYGSKTLRNFSLYITPGIDPRLGKWDFDEVCKAMHHQMGAGITKKEMTARMTKNVNSEKSMILRVMPLFVKNIAMKLVYNAVGEKKACLDMSNLGVVTVPEEMRPYVKRFDFIIGPLPETPYNCAVVTYNGQANISIVRSVKKPELELAFFEQLRGLGIHVKVESNRTNKEK
ncbi:MAG: alpha/beta hydrolase fold domain-containing protein [Eubacteriales bacterium]